MFLHLLRHAHAGDSTTWSGPDEARPLTDKGRGQADRLGRFLAEQQFSTDLVVTSPMVRARQTADIVAEHLGLSVVVDDRLGEVLEAAMVEAILRDHHDPAAPILVGHDPDLSDLVASLCGAAAVPIRKGTFARIESERPLRDHRGTLRWLIPPDVFTLER